MTVCANSPGSSEPVSTAAAHNIQCRNLGLDKCISGSMAVIGTYKDITTSHRRDFSLLNFMRVCVQKMQKKTCQLAQGVIKPPGSSGALITFSTSFAPDLGFK
jgi:hypothetical protein